jgi:inner membrane protein
LASLGHVAIGLASRRWYERQVAPRWTAIGSAAVWGALSMLPDLDVVAFHFGIPYGAPFGHRGATHSFAFAALTGALAWPVARVARLPVRRTVLLVAALVASHPLLDCLTDGGLGCALLWPFSNARFFAPWRPLPVAPIGAAFLSARGLRVALVEMAWFFPAWLYAVWPVRGRPRRARRA